jgi:hypothetical protein
VAASTNKKVLVSRFDKAPVEGFVQLPEALTADGLELLSPAGSILRLPLPEVRAICFIREFEGVETWRKQRTFLSRPKASGLWVRVKFRDGEMLEGVMPNNLLSEPSGFAMVPPDPTFQNQRMFVPREAVTAVEVLGVIGSPLRRRPAKVSTDDGKQIELFN